MSCAALAPTLEHTRLDEERRERVSRVDAADGLAEDAADGELRDLLAVASRAREGNRVGHHQLLDDRFVEALDGWTAQHGMNGVGENAPRPRVEHRLCPLRERAGGIDH